jgi:hypothetical protein
MCCYASVCIMHCLDQYASNEFMYWCVIIVLSSELIVFVQYQASVKVHYIQSAPCAKVFIIQTQMISVIYRYCIVTCPVSEVHHFRNIYLVKRLKCAICL